MQTHWTEYPPRKCGFQLTRHDLRYVSKHSHFSSAIQMKPSAIQMKLQKNLVDRLVEWYFSIRYTNFYLMYCDTPSTEYSEWDPYTPRVTDFFRHFLWSFGGVYSKENLGLSWYFTETYFWTAFTHSKNIQLVIFNWFTVIFLWVNFCSKISVFCRTISLVKKKTDCFFDTLPTILLGSLREQV